MAKKKSGKKAKKSLKQHAKELHHIGKRFVSHTIKTVGIHRNKQTQEKIKKQLKALEKALKELARLER